MVSLVWRPVRPLFKPVDHPGRPRQPLWGRPRRGPQTRHPPAAKPPIDGLLRGRAFQPGCVARDAAPGLGEGRSGLRLATAPEDRAVRVRRSLHGLSQPLPRPRRGPGQPRRHIPPPPTFGDRRSCFLIPPKKRMRQPPPRCQRQGLAGQCAQRPIPRLQLPRLTSHR